MVLIGIVAIVVLLERYRNMDVEVNNNIGFHDKLSEYQLFQGNMAELSPSPSAERYELSSPLYTDYADKQRLILVPEGKKLSVTGDDLPEFPEGTILAKTFYYNNFIASETTTRRVVETRLLIKHNDIWNVGVYKWNDAQDEAFLIEDGESIPISFFDHNNHQHTTDYIIPSQKDCISCHGQPDNAQPIGFKIRNLNVEIERENELVNQLNFLHQAGIMDEVAHEDYPSMVDYADNALPLDLRARAYFAMNCAHCHNPNGSEANSNLDFRYHVQIENTGIQSKRGEIALRVSEPGELHMPKIGTTIQHEEGVKLILDYLKSLEKVH